MKKLGAPILIVLLCLLSACSTAEKSDLFKDDGKIVMFRFEDGTDTDPYRAVYEADDAQYYIAKDGSLRCAAPDGSGSVLLSEGNSGTVFLMIHGDKLYYLNSANDLLERDLNLKTYHLIDGKASKNAYSKDGKIYYLTKEGNPACYDPLTDEKTVGKDTLTDISYVYRDGEDFCLVREKSDDPTGYEIYAITDDCRIEQVDEPVGDFSEGAPSEQTLASREDS